MRLSQEHIFAQSQQDAHSILVDWDNGVITAQDAYNDIIKLKEAGAGYKTVPRHDFHNPHPFGSRYNDPLERKLVDWLTGQDIVMADPLPHPSEDTPQRPNPNQEPSSPYLPGKSPVPSRDDKLASNMPPDINTPYLPGGQRTDGIPNIGNPKLKKKLQQKKGIIGPTGATLPPINLVELNPAQIEALKGIPPNIRDLPKDERLDIMRKITDQVNKAKGLA